MNKNYCYKLLSTFCAMHSLPIPYLVSRLSILFTCKEFGFYLIFVRVLMVTFYYLSNSQLLADETDA